MKTFKISTLAIIIAFLATSCLVDDDVATAAQAETPYTVGFERYNELYLLTPVDVNTIASNMHIELVGGNGGLYSTSDIVVTYQVNEAETTLNASDYNITAPQTFTIPAGEEIATELFSYEIIPTNIPLLEEKMLVVNLLHVSGPYAIGGEPFGKLKVSVTKCDPPLVNTYTVINGNFGGNGETVVVTATSCNTYMASNMPPFGSAYTWNFAHNESNNTVVISGNLDNFSNTVSGSGIVMNDGSIQFSGVSVSDTGLVDYSFTLIPN